MRDEAERIARARGGCAPSFQALMDHHGPPVYRLLVRLTGGRVHDAEDLYQETLLKVAGGMRRYEHQGTFRTWLFRVARNAFLDDRRRRRVPEASLQEVPAPPADPGARLRLAGLEADLSAAADGLTPKLKEVFLMRVYGELTFREIAQVLELPLGTVLARMSYAWAAVRPRLEGWRAPATKAAP